MPKLLILSAEEKSYRCIRDGQTITVDGKYRDSNAWLKDIQEKGV